MPASHRSTALPDHVLAAASAALVCPWPQAGVRDDLRWALRRAVSAEGSAEPLPQLFAGWNSLWPAHGEAPKPQTHRSPGFCSLTSNDPPRKSGPKDRVTRPRLAPLETFVPDANESVRARVRPRPAAEDRASVLRDFLQVHVHPGAARRAQRARTLRAWPSGGLGSQRPRARAGPR